MIIKIAEHCGFCLGVRRALDILEKEIEKGGPVATLGQIVHNEVVIEELVQKGVKVFQRVEEIPSGVTVVLRAHGTPKKIKEILKGKNCRIVDTVCPIVDKIHKKIADLKRAGWQVCVIGRRGHPEVESLMDSGAGLFPDCLGRKIALVLQSTLSCEKLVEAASSLLGKFEELLLVDTECPEVKSRRAEAEDLARWADFVLVVGGRNSSNTKSLYEYVKRINPNSYHIFSSRDVSEEFLRSLDTNSKIAIISGTSTPLNEAVRVAQIMEESGGR